MHHRDGRPALDADESLYHQCDHVQDSRNAEAPATAAVPSDHDQLNKPPVSPPKMYIMYPSKPYASCYVNLDRCTVFEVRYLETLRREKPGPCVSNVLDDPKIFSRVAGAPGAHPPSFWIP